jgi:hypothetical protein
MISLDSIICESCHVIICNDCGKYSCPKCSKTIYNHKTIDGFVKNQINKLYIKCKNFKLGCKVEIDFQSYQTHLENCRFKNENKTASNIGNTKEAGESYKEDVFKSGSMLNQKTYRPEVSEQLTVQKTVKVGKERDSASKKLNTKKRKSKKNLTFKELDDLTVAELKDILKELGQPYSNRVKDELITDILVFQSSRKKKINSAEISSDSYDDVSSGSEEEIKPLKKQKIEYAPKLDNLREKEMKKLNLMLTKSKYMKELDSLTVPDLKDILKDIGHPYSNRTKDELIKELLDASEYYDFDNLIKKKIKSKETPSFLTNYENPKTLMSNPFLTMDKIITPPKFPKKNQFSASDLDYFTIPDLKDMAKTLGRPYSNRNKEELIGEILYAQNEFNDDNVIKRKLRFGQLADHTNEELKMILSCRGLPVSGSKKELLEKIQAYLYLKDGY